MCDRAVLRRSAEVYFENEYFLYASTRDPRDPPDVLPGSGVAILRRRISLGWAVAAQAAVAAAATVAIVASWPASKPTEDYRLLASASAQPAKGNAIVLFAPEMTARDLRGALDAAGARIVGGPTASGAFVLQVDQATRTEVLGKLRGSKQVVLAEPIDPASGP